MNQRLKMLFNHGDKEHNFKEKMQIKEIPKSLNFLVIRQSAKNMIVSKERLNFLRWLRSGAACEQKGKEKCILLKELLWHFRIITFTAHGRVFNIITRFVPGERCSLPHLKKKALK